MIRFADTADLPAVRQLWETCFPDEGGFNDYFFAHIFRSEHTLLLLAQDTLCAMVQMLPCTLRTPAGNQAATYIYGACTAPAMRKRGYMAELLQHTFTLDRAAGRVASILIPQEAWLFGFYEKFGYQPAFYVHEGCSVSAHMDAACRRMTEEDIPALRAFYETQTASLPYAITRSCAEWQEQLSMFQALGGDAFALQDGAQLRAYAFVWQEEHGAWAQELLADSEDSAARLCAAICASLGCAQLRFTQNGDSRALGCAKFYDNRPAVRGYINLMFN